MRANIRRLYSNTDQVIFVHRLNEVKTVDYKSYQIVLTIILGLVKYRRIKNQQNMNALMPLKSAIYTFTQFFKNSML